MRYKTNARAHTHVDFLLFLTDSETIVKTSGNVEHFWQAGAIRKDVVCIIVYCVIKIFVQNQGYIVTKTH